MVTLKPDPTYNRIIQLSYRLPPFLKINFPVNNRGELLYEIIKSHCRMAQ